MTYILSKLFWGLAQPLNLFVLAALCGAGAMAAGRRRLGTQIVAGAFVAFFTVLLLPAGQVLLIPLENRFPRPHPFPEQVAGIIVLGGAIDGDISEARGFITTTANGARLTEALALARRYPQAKILFTGGSGDVLGPKYREGIYARRFFLEQGIAEERLVIESRSRNTWENAQFSKDMLKPAPGEIWLLVTSAYHMPRSVGIFRRIGWRIMPDPVDYRTEGHFDIRGLQLIDRLRELDLAMKEWVGLAAYSALGRTDSLFPSPSE